MKKVIMYQTRTANERCLNNAWYLERIWNDWDGVYSDEYEVELPDEYHIGQTSSGEKLIFRDDYNYGFEIYNESYNENAKPYFYDTKLSKRIKLNVIGPAEE